MNALSRPGNLGLAGVIALAVACSNAGDKRIPDPLSPTSPTHWSLDKLSSGDDLPADTVLARELLRVLVRADGSPASGVSVTWTVTGPATAVDSSTTDADGVATMSFAFGAKAGLYTVQASLSRRPELPPVSFSGNAVPGHASSIRVLSGSGQTDTATAQLRDDFVVQASDSHGNATSGATIDWAVTSGDGSLSRAQTTVDSSGTSAVRYTLGSAVGPSTVTATLHGLDAMVEFRAVASPGNPAKLTMVSGNNQTAEVGHALAADYVVKVSDRHDNPVPGVSIDWAITGGGGTLSASAVPSGPDGLGATHSTLGPVAAVQFVSASLHAWPNAGAVSFSSTGTWPPGPTLLVVGGGGQTGLIGTKLPSPILVRAVDASGHGIAGQTIAFSVPAVWGSVAPTTVNTDAQGFAETAWTLGSSAGVASMTAAVPFTTSLVAVTATIALPPLAFMRDPIDGGGPLDGSVGIGQLIEGAVGPASQIPVAAGATVTLSGGSHVGVPASLTIPVGTTFTRFRPTGISIGTDTVIASAPGFAPARIVVTVGVGTILFTGFTVHVSSAVQTSFCIAAPDGAQTFDAVGAKFSLNASANITVADEFSPNTPITSIGFGPPGADCIGVSIKGVSVGAATLTISSPNYKPVTANINVIP